MRQFGVVLGPLCILFRDKLALTLTIGALTVEATQVRRGFKYRGGRNNSEKGIKTK